MDLTKINNIVFEGIDHSDAPDYCDAYIVSADYDDREMTDVEIESLDCCFVYEKLMDHLY